MSDIDKFNTNRPFKESDFNSRIPRYNDDSDYTTNAPSYYDDLARKQKLHGLGDFTKNLNIGQWSFEVSHKKKGGDA